MYVVKSVCLCNVLSMANCIKTLKPFSGTAVLIPSEIQKKKKKTKATLPPCLPCCSKKKKICLRIYNALGFVHNTLLGIKNGLS